MTHNCCICGEQIDSNALYTLTIRKENCETEQELYCHEVCLEQMLRDPKTLYIKHL